ncbi:UDP-N-acetylglucosamine 2-epimerase [Tabrizicola soli]|uniref:UDP-N-acetylglucosamine 2-epimerase n=1 Tax=Tabrizicola soli TaxID=2185115 RepID=UPI00363FDBB7
MTRHLLFLTGTRADFGKLEPLAAAARDAGHLVTFFVTGMHMMDRYGLTRNEVRRMPGIAVEEFVNQQEGDPQDLILARTVTGFSAFVHRARPDLIVLHGDRIEAMAGALVAATNYIRSAHVEGGEVSGTIDEVFRHCNTKLCTHHFVSSEAAARRVRALGEPEETIHAIGSPELDFHARPSGVTLDEVRAHYAIPFAEFGIATFHPVTSEQDTIGRQAADLFGALADSGRSFVTIAPNNDPGSQAIFEVLEKLPRDRFRLLPSMRFAHFSELMKNAACMVGNSSAGVREAPLPRPALARHRHPPVQPLRRALGHRLRGRGPRRDPRFPAHPLGPPGRPACGFRPGHSRAAFRGNPRPARVLEHQPAKGLP